MSKWNILPEWARWILCWPVIIVGTGIGGFITKMLVDLAFDRVWMPESALEIAGPATQTLIGASIFYALIEQFVPRRPDIVAGFWALIVLVLTVMSVIRWWFEITEGLVPWDALLQDVLQTTAAASVTVYYFLKLRADEKIIP